MKELKWIGLIAAGVAVGVVYLIAKQSKNKPHSTTDNNTITTSKETVAPQEQTLPNEAPVLEDIKNDVASSIREKHAFASDIIKESVDNVVNKQYESVDDSEFDDTNDKIHTILGM